MRDSMSPSMSEGDARSVRARFRSFRSAALFLGIVAIRVAVVVVAIHIAGFLLLRPWQSEGSLVELVRGWYDSIVGDLDLWPALAGQTLAVCGTASAVGVFVGRPIALLLFRTDLPGRRFFGVILLLLACLPVFAAAAAALAVIGLRTWDGNPWMAGLIHGWIGLPISILLLGVGLSRVDGDLERAALLDASRWRVFGWLDARWTRWSTLAVVALQTYLAGTEIMVTDLMKVQTLAEAVYVRFQLHQSAASQSAIVVPYVLLFGALVWSVLWLTRREMENTGANRAEPLVIRLGGWRWPAAVFMAVFLLCVVAWPWYRLGGMTGGFGSAVEHAQDLGKELRQAVWLAGGTALLILPLLLALLDTYSSEGRSGGRFAVRASLVLLLATPTPHLCIFLITALNRPGPGIAIVDSMAMPMLGQALKWLPLAVLLAAPGLASVTRDMRAAARLDGCGQGAMHWHILWPMAWRFVALSLVAMLILVFGELTTNVLLAPPGVSPISVRFFTLVHYGLEEEAATICFLAALCLMVPWTLLVVLLARRRS
jgi:iron(III) transport system permease protein